MALNITMAWDNMGFQRHIFFRIDNLFVLEKP